VSYLDLTAEGVDGGKMFMIMPGLNWYWSHYARMQFNYGFADVNGGPSPGALHILQGRLQITF
jgi:hypothetical protein